MGDKVLIIDCTGKSYHGGNHESLALGGIERTIIGLSGALVRRGYDVSVRGAVSAPVTADGVTWLPRDVKSDIRYDHVIACNDPRLFDVYERATGHRDFKPYLWVHNRLTLGKIFRKRRLLPLLRWRPVAVFLSPDHHNATVRFLPCRRRAIIPHGVDRQVIDAAPVAERAVAAPSPVAVFISQAYRGLGGIIDLWRRDVHPGIPGARLEIYCDADSVAAVSPLPAAALETYGIHVMGRRPRGPLLAAMSHARACLIPGHPDETFCLSAAECSVLRIPILTYGTGALKDRVVHGINGMIVSKDSDFSLTLRRMLTDDILWRDLHHAARPENLALDWDQAAAQWDRLFRGSDHTGHRA